MSNRTSTRRDGFEKLAVGLIGLPLNIILMLVLLPVFYGAWLLNGLAKLLLGVAIWKGDSRLGFWLWWVQGNIQSLATGRGQFEWTP